MFAAFTRAAEQFYNQGCL